MDIQGKTILLLGGAGEVGMAIARKLLEDREHPQKLIIASLKQEEAEEAVRELQEEFQGVEVEFATEYGNIFVREEFKDRAWWELQADPACQEALMDDILNELTPEILENSTVYRMILRHKPHLIVDTINTATALAYQDVYTTARQARELLGDGDEAALKNMVRRLLSTLYIPQLVRHVQIMHRAMVDAGVQLYLKVGTTGTGGMGLNIPYTHGEERPSRVLLSKSAVAGAHSLLLFLADRTPGGPVVKEIKPAALIAWKAIRSGRIRKRGREFPLYRVTLDQAMPLEPGQTFDLKRLPESPTGDEYLEAVFVDTGENGVFSLEEFKAITTLRQMEAVTPEEIAEVVLDEIKGDNTSFDVVSALDASVMGPTYRAAFLRPLVIHRMHREMERTGLDSVAFEILGPPRLSKLLFEAELLKRVFGTIPRVLARSPESVSQQLIAYLEEHPRFLQEILAVGLAVLLPGPKLVFARRRDTLLDKHWERTVWQATEEQIQRWAHSEWVDLRPENMEHWQNRLRRLLRTLEKENQTTGSRFDRPLDAWPRDEHGEPVVDPGETVGYLFIVEDGGARKKR